MPAQNIGTIDLLAESESFDDARLPISAEVDDRWRGRAITGAGLLKIASSALVLTGEDAPPASLLMAGRRAFYFRTNSDGDVFELHVSLDGESWKGVDVGDGADFMQGTGIRITDNGDGTKTISVSRPFTQADERRLDELTDDYINALIAAAGHWREHFSIRYSDQLHPVIGARWRQETQGDGTGHLIRIVPSGANLGVIQAVRQGSQIQVRTTANEVVSTFTVESDPAAPNADGVWEILGEWDQVRTFNDLTEYVLYFSDSRHHAIETDDSTTTGDGTRSRPVKVKNGGIGDTQISGSLTDIQKRNVRNKIGSVTVTAAEDAPSNPLDGDLHIYTNNVENLVDHERLGGRPVTEAPANTIFRWNAIRSRWIYVIFVELQDGVVVARHISIGMTDDEKRAFRQRVGAVIVTTGSNAPSDPITGDVHIYDEAASGLRDHYENNGATTRSRANAGDIFRHDDLNSKWILEVEAPDAADPIDDDDISGSLSNSQKKSFRSKIGGERTTLGGSVPSLPNVDDIHIYSSNASSLSNHVDSDGNTVLNSVSEREVVKWNGTNWVRLISALELPDDQTAEEIRDALQTLTGNNRLPASAIRDLPSGDGQGGGQASFYEYANRTIVADADRDTDSEIAIVPDTGTLYDLKIARNSDLYHLPDVNTGVQVRITQGLVSWAGRVTNRSVASGLYTIKIDFHQRRGTFTTEQTCKVEIGAIPTNQRTYIYGENQTERFPSKVFTVADYGITTHGLKQFKDAAGETYNGGIDFTIQDVNDASAIDTDISTNVTDCIIRIDEDVPRCRIKFSFRSRDNPSGPHFMQLKKVDSGGDDGLVLATQGYDFTNTQSAVDLAAAGSIYEADEDDIELSNGDQLYLRTYGIPTSGFDSITVGYVLLERQE